MGSLAVEKWRHRKHKPMTVMQISCRLTILICLVHVLYLISISESTKFLATLFGSCENYFYLSKNYIYLFPTSMVLSYVAMYLAYKDKH